MFHAHQLAHAGAGARAEVAIPIIARLGVFTGPVRHGGIRTGVNIPYRQIKQAGLADQRHLGDAHIKTDVPFLQIAHHAAGGIQPEGTAAGKQDRMDALCRSQRVEQLTFPAGGAAAAHIQPGRRAVFAQQKHRAAGGRLRVFRAADFQPFKIPNGYFFHCFTP